jgi:hypothetical protein
MQSCPQPTFLRRSECPQEEDLRAALSLVEQGQDPGSRLDWGISPLGWQRLRLAGGSVGSAATRPCEMGCSPIHAPP